MISVAFSAVFASFPMLWLSLHALNLSVRFPRPFDSSGAHPALRLGESGSFSSAGCMLMVLIAFLAIFASFPMHGVSMCPLNGSVGFPQPFGLSGSRFVALIGRFGHFDSIGHMLMVPASSAGVIEYMHIFSVHGVLLDLSVLFAQPFVPLVSGFHSFVRRPKANLGQTTTLRNSEGKGRIGLNCLSVNPKRAQMGSLLVLDCTLYILEYMWAV